MLEDTIVVANGSTFAVSGRSGDIVGEEFQGLFKADTRFLSGYGLKVNERSPQTLSSGNLDSDRASFYLTNKQARGLGSQQVTVIRDRRVRNTGLHDEITISNHSQSARQIHLTLAFAADFADVFEIRLGRRQQAGRISVETANDQIALTYRHGHYERQTIITFSRPPHLAGQTASFEVDLAPKAEWQVCVDISPRDDPTQPVPSIACDRHWFDATYRPSLPDVTLPDGELTPNGAGWPVPLPDLATDDDSLTGAYRQAVHDLKALTMHVGGGRLILAAGLPWFMAIFGRDSLISAYQTILLGPRLARDTLQILAKFQATQVNDFRDAQPGKIPHEIRHGELSVLDRLPHARYYGTVDATPLFLILLSEVYRWAGDLDFVRSLLPAARRAIEWIDQYGDLDGDGFVEYQRRSQYGLLNQGWKDSNDSIAFADGTLARGPLALCEVQGYVYDAKCRLAELLEATGDQSGADELRTAAEGLRRRFEEAFWLPEAGFYALALDGRKRRVDSITSNVGHCLWSGIVAPDRGARIAERLLAPDMFTGWGIRTMSSEMRAYNPISYHNGSVWPHDTSLVAAGLARYGFRREAGAVLRGLIDATGRLDRHRPPEVFAGFPRRRRGFPPAYRTANAPQAWATGAIILAIRLLLGAEPGAASIATSPIEGAPGLRLTGVDYRGRKVTVGSAD